MRAELRFLHLRSRQPLDRALAATDPRGRMRGEYRLEVEVVFKLHGCYFVSANMSTLR